MKKVIVTESGKVGFIDGAFAGGTTLEVEGDPTVEVLDASHVDDKSWDDMRKEKEYKSVKKELKGKKIK